MTCPYCNPCLDPYAIPMSTLNMALLFTLMSVEIEQPKLGAMVRGPTEDHAETGRDVLRTRPEIAPWWTEERAAYVLQGPKQRRACRF